MIVNISIIGCDDTTDFQYEMNRDEYEFLNRIAKKSREISSYSCEPVIMLKIIKGEEELIIRAKTLKDNLCFFCSNEIPSCKSSYVEFGTGKGYDNIIACNSFKEKKI